jgi:hypothetical protein
MKDLQIRIRWLKMESLSFDHVTMLKKLQELEQNRYHIITIINIFY